MTKEFIEFKSSLSSLKVLVWGIGIAGGGVNIAKYFAENGSVVRAIDTKDREALKESVEVLEKYKNIYIHLGEHREDDFLWADLIIKNPAVPPTNEFLKFCKEKNKKVETEISLFMRYAKGFKIGITGTRGKSTTTALLNHVLQTAGKKVFNGGNNRISLINQIQDIQENDFVVMEISSFMCDSLRENKLSSNLTIITNLYPDHLNWHPSMRHYIDSKGALLEFQTEKDSAVLNITNPIVKENYINLGRGKKILIDEVSIDGVMNRLVFFNVKNEELEGRHNLENIALIWFACKGIGLPEDTIARSIATYKGLEYRQQKIAEKDGIVFINDSASTMSEATVACIERFREKGNIHLILGGVDKQLPVERLIENLKKTTTIHFLEGSLYDKIKEYFVDKNSKLSDLSKDQRIFGPFNSLDNAILSAYEQAKCYGGYVILSPAGASFNMFKNEFDRGQKFNEAVKRLILDK